MVELVGHNWPIFALLAVLGLLVLVWVVLGSRKTRISRADPPVEPASPKRNQALIDAAPAAAPRLRADPPIPGSGALPGAPAPEGEGPLAAPLPPPASREDPLAPGSLSASAAPAPEPGPEPGATPAPAPSPTPGSGAPRPEGGDDLTLIKGIGPRLSDQLGALGITAFAQIAAWDDAEIDRIDARLGRFQGRIRRDQWVEQARLLASGDLAGFARAFGNA